MARRNLLPDPTKMMEGQRYCRECASAYDFNSPGASGLMIFCRCRHDERSGFGKFCKFASDRACPLFREAEKPQT